MNIPPGGLSESQARERLQQYGPNELQSVARFKLLKMILSQFSNMFLILLLFASLVSWLTGAGSDALIIAAIVLANATISFIQEYKAEQSLKSLQTMMADLAHVVRDGSVKRIPAKLIVPGDIVQVEAGDRIPADGLILECINGMINESSLTGESVPVSKKAATVPFVSMVIFQMFNIFNCRHPRSSILDRSLWKNRYVLGAVGISTVATMLLVSLPGSAQAFHVTRLSVVDWAIMALVSGSIVVLNEIGKRIVYGRRVG